MGAFAPWARQMGARRTVSLWHKIASHRDTAKKEQETSEDYKIAFCSRHWLLLPGGSFCSQCLDSPLENYPFLSLGLRGGHVTWAWPISISHWLGLYDWFKGGPGIPAGPMRALPRTFARTHWEPGQGAFSSGVAIFRVSSWSWD